MPEKNALAKLAGRLEQIAKVERESALFYGDSLGSSNDIYKAARIIAKLATEWEPIDRSKVEKGADGRVHLADIVRSGDKRRCEIMIACMEIAEEGQA